MKFMKDAPTVVSELYDPFITKTKASDTVPLYKLPSSATKYLSQFEKYVRDGLAYNIERFVVRVLRQVVKNGFVRQGDLYIKQDIRELTNSNLRNKLSEYYDWYELVRNASS